MFLYNHKNSHQHTFVNRSLCISHNNWYNLSNSYLYKKYYILQNNY